LFGLCVGEEWLIDGLQVVSREEALSRIQKQNEPYKIELLEAIPQGAGYLNVTVASMQQASSGWVTF
jgi:hypothetical protein